MEHDMHLRDDVDQAGPFAKIIIMVVILAAFLAVGAYVVYGSGMWSPHVQQSSL